MVDILNAVLTDGLPAVEAACAEALTVTEVERVESRPKELHLRPLAERCMSLSTHTAPIRQTRRSLDVWMTRMFPDLPWCRYADDGLAHCRTEEEADAIKAALQARLAACGLEMHPDKTQIVYCKDSNRKDAYPKGQMA
jgi:retron-type reverse transcriptase